MKRLLNWLRRRKLDRYKAELAACTAYTAALHKTWADPATCRRFYRTLERAAYLKVRIAQLEEQNAH